MYIRSVMKRSCVCIRHLSARTAKRTTLALQVKTDAKTKVILQDLLRRDKLPFAASRRGLLMSAQLSLFRGVYFDLSLLDFRTKRNSTQSRDRRFDLISFDAQVWPHHQPHLRVFFLD